MTQKDEALQILKDYNAWRRGNDCDLDTTLPMPDPKKIGEAIDFAITVLSEPEQVSLPDGWVAVDKEIPADGVYVIAAYIKDWEICNWDKLRYSSTAKKWYRGNQQIGVDYNYWMPLPSAPKLPKD